MWGLLLMLATILMISVCISFFLYSISSIEMNIVVRVIVSLSLVLFVIKVFYPLLGYSIDLTLESLFNLLNHGK